MKIFINPGHSVDGEDHGACYNGLRECDVALNIAERVTDYLRAAGLEVKLFQADWLEQICDASNYWDSDLFVSIHCNAAEDACACGTETFYFYGSDAGRRLARCIQNQIVHSLGTVWRRVEGRGFAVLSGTKCPAVLIETAFISNVDEARLLVEREDDFARAIARGVTDYLSANPLPDVIER